MIETRTDIDTGAGSMPTFIFHPEEDGPFPVVFYLMDAPSIRPALMDMASRLATAGYYVMMPYLYYRKSAFRVFGQSDEEMHERRELMQSVTRDGAMQDASALWQHAQKDPNANTAAKLGAVGFCMSGSLVLALAQQWRDRVGGVASIHGAWLVNDKQDSPHRRLQGISAEVYFGWADNDPTAPREDLATMREALQQAGVRHRIDFYEDAVHGYAPPGTERYNRAASEQHWERVHAMFRRTLR
ncbi:MAG: dienelactone hydrolase family protein [Pseudomonadales bacterium]